MLDADEAIGKIQNLRKHGDRGYVREQGGTLPAQIRVKLHRYANRTMLPVFELAELPDWQIRLTPTSYNDDACLPLCNLISMIPDEHTDFILWLMILFKDRLKTTMFFMVQLF